jgi:hypothetical protein
MNQDRLVSTARDREAAALRRAEGAERRLATSQAELREATDDRTRAALEHEVQVHQRAAEMHRSAAVLQHKHALDHEQR